MADVFDLASLKDKKAIETPDFDSLTPEEQEAVAAQAAANADKVPATKVRTAFLVVVDDNGVVSALPDLDFRLERRYSPTAHDVIGAAAVIQADAISQMAGQHSAMGIQQMASMQMEQMQNQQIASQLNLKPRH